MKNKDWLIMLLKEVENWTYTLTICQDGYVFYNKKKLFVLKKSAMKELNILMNTYEELNLNEVFESKNLVKFNGDTKFMSNDRDLFLKIIHLVYKADNIKHPPELLDEGIALIEELRATGELDAMIEADGMDAVVDRLISMYQ